jgi:hypothetical protein
MTHRGATQHFHGPRPLPEICRRKFTDIRFLGVPITAGRRRAASGTPQPEEFFQESSGGDEPEPPIGHAAHSHMPSLTPARAPACELLHNRP